LRLSSLFWAGGRGGEAQTFFVQDDNLSGDKSFEIGP